MGVGSLFVLDRFEFFGLQVVCVELVRSCGLSDVCLLLVIWASCQEIVLDARLRILVKTSRLTKWLVVDLGSGHQSLDFPANFRIFRDRIAL